ncbi:MAG: hypothetical protein DMG78_19950 [Acidobacteria bacterium]|nr:MAG: hypothetical protein DMG78_19950 [Acidobacteriota bacterium]
MDDLPVQEFYTEIRMVPDQNPVALYRVPSRRIDDRIRDLCAKVARSDGNDYEPTLSELKAALREHTDGLRKMAVESLAKKAVPFKDRRKS